MVYRRVHVLSYILIVRTWALDASWNVMAHGDARDGKWRGNWRMEWVASTLHTTSEHCVSSITTADAHTSAVSSRLNWPPHPPPPGRFKWTRPFRRKTKSGFCACAFTFQLASTNNIKEQNLTLNSGLSFNEGTAAGRHLQGQTDLPLGRLIVLLRKLDQTKECRLTNNHMHLIFCSTIQLRKILIFENSFLTFHWNPPVPLPLTYLLTYLLHGAESFLRS